MENHSWSLGLKQAFWRQGSAQCGTWLCKGRRPIESPGQTWLKIVDCGYTWDWEWHTSPGGSRLGKQSELQTWGTVELDLRDESWMGYSWLTGFVFYSIRRKWCPTGPAGMTMPNQSYQKIERYGNFVIPPTVFTDYFLVMILKSSNNLRIHFPVSVVLQVFIALRNVFFS